jgi:AcrR family transcriptional regulator
MPAQLTKSKSKDREKPPKRDRTRATLIKAAFSVYARKGFDAPTIDDFIIEAGVSRGTFYNYFQTREDLMAAVAADLATFISGRIDAATRSVPDPVERVSIAARYFVALGAENETRAWVFARMIPIVGGPLTLAMSEHVRSEMEAAAATGRVRVRSISAGIDLTLGMMAMAIRHNLSRRAQPYPPELVAAMVLQALGASFKEAEEVANRPLPAAGDPSSRPDADSGDGQKRVVRQSIQTGRRGLPAGRRRVDRRQHG